MLGQSCQSPLLGLRRNQNQTNHGMARLATESNQTTGDSVLVRRWPGLNDSRRAMLMSQSSTTWWNPQQGHKRQDWLGWHPFIQSKILLSNMSRTNISECRARNRCVMTAHLTGQSTHAYFSRCTLCSTVHSCVHVSSNALASLPIQIEVVCWQHCACFIVNLPHRLETEPSIPLHRSRLLWLIWPKR